MLSFKQLSLIALVTAFCVVVLGAYVRLSDAGLGCPDWPGCYGTLTVPQSIEAIAQAQQDYPNNPVETVKAWKEMLHRYLAGSLGLMVLALAIMAWRQRAHIHTSPWLSSTLLVLIALQAMLGMWTVTLLLKPVIVSLHLLGGMTTLGLLTWIYSCNRKATIPTVVKQLQVHRSYIYWLRLSVVVLLIQLLLGAWTSSNYAALACTDFPTCHGQMIPNMDFKDAFYIKRALGESVVGGTLSLEAITAIQWSHRLGALLVLIVLVPLAMTGMRYSSTKLMSTVLLLVLLLQVLIGIGNLLLHLPTVLAVLHNAGAACLVMILVALNARITVNNHLSRSKK